MEEREKMKLLIAKVEDWYQRLRIEYPPWMQTTGFEEIIAKMEEEVEKE